jgi:hypothetical protein
MFSLTCYEGVILESVVNQTKPAPGADHAAFAHIVKAPAPCLSLGGGAGVDLQSKMVHVQMKQKSSLQTFETVVSKLNTIESVGFTKTKQSSCYMHNV